MAYALEHPHRNQVVFASTLDLLAGVWLFVSAFVGRMDVALAWSCGIVGAIVVILAAIRALGTYGDAWLSWINVLLGIWTVFSPWIVSAGVQRSSSGVVWDTVILGIIIIVLAAWSAIATGSENYDRTGPA